MDNGNISEKTFVWHMYSKQLIVIFFVAFIFRSLLYLLILRHDSGAFARYGDSTNYVNAANNLLEYKTLCEQKVYPPYPGIFRTPGYPFFMTAIYYFSGFSNSVVVFVQVILSSLTCPLLFLVSARYSSATAATISALILAIDIPSIKSANEIMTETLFTFVLLVLVIVIIKFFESGKSIYMSAAGILCAVGALIRPILLYFFILLLIILFIYFRRNLRRFMLLSIIFTTAFMILIFPWLYRNWSIGYIGFAAVQEVNIYSFKAGWIEGELNGKKNIGYSDFQKRFEKVDLILKERGIANTPVNRVKIYKELGTRTLLENPLLTLKYQMIYTAKVFTSPGVEEFLSVISRYKPSTESRFLKDFLKFVYGTILYAAYLLLLIGIVNRKPWQNPCSLVVVAVLLAYLAVLSGEWGAESRFRVPIIPLILIFSAAGMDKISFFIKNIISAKPKAKT